MLSQNLDRKWVVRLVLVLLVGLVGILTAVSLTSTDLIIFGRPDVDAVIRNDRPTPAYLHQWDENPVAYIPEADVIRKRRYPHNWDENPVAYIPEADVIR